MADVAIIGMSCIFPGAKDLREYWQNILSGVNAIGDPPADWEAHRYHDPAADDNDRIYCRKGGYLGDLARFDPLEFGVMPNSLDGGEPDHYLALKVARTALEDAGIGEEAIVPERTEVIVGRGTYINRGVINTFQHGVAIDQTLEILRELHPEYTAGELARIKARLKAGLPNFSAETVASLVPNVLAGRIANRLNLMGANYLVDAACASSLVAVEHGMRDLADGRCDLALVGGVNASIPPPILMIFCRINALSRRERLSPFDESADGTLLGEGLGFVVLKRRADAERDGDRIYAVLKGVGIASDGRQLGLLTPRLEGEALAIRRAYDEAGVDPSTVGLVEAHGTGTPVGDRTEIQALGRVFGPRGPRGASCALGTVKSMIGHLIPASGIAGLIKTALALHHKVLPPTLNCERPNPALELEKTPFYMNTATRPWIHGAPDVPRRAAVSAFGFGGISAHAVLEEASGTGRPPAGLLHRRRDTELFLFGAASREALLDELSRASTYLDANPAADLADLAFSLGRRAGNGPFRLAVVSGSTDDLARKLAHAAGRLSDPSCARIRDRHGIYHFAKPLGPGGKVAFLFPGEGSQYASMLADLCIHFPEVRAKFDLLDRAFHRHERGYLPSDTIFPPPGPRGKGADGLYAMDRGAESVFAATQALLGLMDCLKIVPDLMAGHSTGEYSALLASGMLELAGEDEYVDFVRGVNGIYERVARSGGIAGGVLLSVGAARREALEEIVAASPGPLHVAMENCPNQFVLCGAEADVRAAEERLRAIGAMTERLPFDRAYHTPLFGAIGPLLLEYFGGLRIGAPSVRTFSCASAGPYPDDPAGIRELATSQWARKVRFIDTVEAMYAEGARIFIEVGPRNTLTSFVDDILRKRSYLAVSADHHRLPGTTQLNHMLGLLFAHRVPFDPSILHRHRAASDLFAEGEAGGRPGKTARREPVKIDLTLPRLRLEGAGDLRPAAAAGGEVAVAPAAGPGAGPGPEASSPRPFVPDPRVMLEHMKTMERFLATQDEVFRMFLGSPPATAPPAPSPGGTLPFVREVVSCGPGEAVVRLAISTGEDRFLLDHTIGGAVSQASPSLTALPVVPMTFSMEIMAEAASLLAPGKRLVGMKEVRAYRWIGLDEGSRTLRVTAKAAPGAPGEVEVAVREDEGTAGAGDVPRMPLIEGTMVFADAYPVAPQAGPFPLADSRPSRWSGVDLYDGFMFHGPSLRGVASMDLWGSDGSTATLRGMPAGELFASFPGIAFLCDPITLDAAGQVIAYWTSDHLERAYHIFPFRLEALHLFGPGLAAGEKASCRARIVLEEDRLVRSDIDIVAGDGSVRMRLAGWWDRRFDLPEPFFALRRSPRTGTMGRDLPCAPHGVVARVIEAQGDFLSAHDRIWQRVLGHLVLGERERADWKELKGTPGRRTEWLLGRAAAKDAVRVFVRNGGGPALCPADIEIGADADGRPFVAGIRGERGGPFPSISISHKEGIAVALAAEPGGREGVGVDVEDLREPGKGFGEVAFTARERELLLRADPSGGAEWTLRFWCAKEAVMKAVGGRAVGAPGNFEVREADAGTGTLVLGPSEALLARVPALAGRTFRAGTVREGNRIFAISCWNPRRTN